MTMSRDVIGRQRVVRDLLLGVHQREQIVIVERHLRPPAPRGSSAPSRTPRSPPARRCRRRRGRRAPPRSCSSTSREPHRRRERVGVGVVMGEHQPLPPPLELLHQPLDARLGGQRGDDRIQWARRAADGASSVGPRRGRGST